MNAEIIPIEPDAANTDEGSIDFFVRKWTPTYLEATEKVHTFQFG